METTLLKNFVNIDLPLEAADVYFMNKSKNQIENFIFIEPEWYNQLFNQNTFYILGSKGSGKTLYAAYMCADMRNNTVSKIHKIDVADYGKLIAMKSAHHLDFTDYLTMWKVILLQKFLFGIGIKEIAFWGRTKNFGEIQQTISSYFGYDVTNDAFNPVSVIDSYGKQQEVTHYLAEQVEGNLSIPSATINGTGKTAVEHKKVDNSSSKLEKNSLVYTDTWLRAINQFQKTISNMVFKYNHFLFIDGLDVRPKEIDTREYEECISALVRAVYEINTQILGKMERKDSNDFKIIALTRTDIFLNSELINVTSCINDNCVKLDWSYSNERDFSYSNLYKMMNRVLGWDGSITRISDMPVERYFSFKMPFPLQRPISAATYIQRQSRLRPRDIVVFLRLIQNECKKRGLANPNATILDSSDLISDYSNYYTDQIKSEMTFNYTSEQIKQIFGLIKMIRSDTFGEETFKTTFNQYCLNQPSFLSVFPTYQDVLNVLYSLDMISWMEDVSSKPRMHWHYREVKAIDETYKLPWEQIMTAQNVNFTIHRGTKKNILGVSRRSNSR